MSKLTPKTGTVTIRCINMSSDNWKSTFLYPLFELKRYTFYTMPGLYRRSVIEGFARGLIMTQDDLVAHTIWNTELENCVDEVML